MMMISLMPYPASNPFALNAFSTAGYNGNTTPLSPFSQTTGNNYFPVFGSTAGFGGMGESPYNQHSSAYGHHYQEGSLNGWASIIQLVLSQLLHPAEVAPQKHPNVRVYNNEADYTRYEPKVMLHKKRMLEAVLAKKADLPEGLTPLSYEAMMDNPAYKTEAIDAVKQWQAYLTTYGKQLDTTAGREQWTDGAVIYLALLNDSKVRDLLMQEKPQLIGTYYNRVLRTFREDDGVRAMMKKTEQNAKILAIVDKTNKTIFEHRIFKNEAS